MTLPPKLTWSFGLILCSLPTTAWADTRAQCERSDCTYHFDDDPLASPGLDVYADWLKNNHPPPPRVLLIRPRLSFVPELLISGNRF